MNYLIEEQSQLSELGPLFDELSHNRGLIAVDTEFLREKTYSAKLCLVQLGIGEDQYCIDVLAIDDLTLLSELFANENILKLLHAARQDMEVIYQTLNVLPKPIFDTQLAAAFLGMDMQAGYSTLVKDRLDIELPKSQARTDWTRRPLSQEQIAYAGDDVAHLEQLYTLAIEEMKNDNKLEWYDEEIESFYDITKYVIDPVDAYKRLSGGGLNLTQQYTLRDLAEWRESMAQKRDIPRTWVLKDDRLYDLAVRRPATEEAIKEMAIFGKKSAPRFAPIAAKIISEVVVGEQRLWRKVAPLDKKQKSFCSGLMKQLTKLSEQGRVAQGLLGTRKDIESLYRHRTSTKLLSGWRKQVVGDQLLETIVTSEA